MAVPFELEFYAEVILKLHGKRSVGQGCFVADFRRKLLDHHIDEDTVARS